MTTSVRFAPKVVPHGAQRRTDSHTRVRDRMTAIKVTMTPTNTAVIRRKPSSGGHNTAACIRSPEPQSGFPMNTSYLPLHPKAHQSDYPTRV
jgi:hypothetical protein